MGATTPSTIYTQKPTEESLITHAPTPPNFVSLSPTVEKVYTQKPTEESDDKTFSPTPTKYNSQTRVPTTTSGKDEVEVEGGATTPSRRAAVTVGETGRRHLLMLPAGWSARTTEIVANSSDAPSFMVDMQVN